MKADEFKVILMSEVSFSRMKDVTGYFDDDDGFDDDEEASLVTTVVVVVVVTLIVSSSLAITIVGLLADDVSGGERSMLICMM